MAGHPMFAELLKKMQEVHDAKNEDYGAGNPLGNFELAQAMGIAPWVGILVRISDKFSRLCTFARKGIYKVKDESVEDTLLDLANYALLCIIMYRAEKNKK